MSLRLLGCSLLVIVLAAFTLQTPRTARSSNNAASETPPKWEYAVTRLDAGQCSAAPAIAASLNERGQEGWELVSFDRYTPPPVIPTESKGTLLIKPAATGPGQTTNPPTADSFTGEIDMKIPPVQQPAGGCLLVLKREVPRSQ
jgi:hypothetical protein